MSVAMPFLFPQLHGLYNLSYFMDYGHENEIIFNESPWSIFQRLLAIISQ
jgi:hypothetical protein